MKTGNYALPLYGIVDRHKIDLNSPQLDELAEQLRAYLEVKIGIAVLDSRIEVLGRDPYLVLNGMAEPSLPKLFALADVQNTQVFGYRRNTEGEATLTPLAVDPDKGDPGLP